MRRRRRRRRSLQRQLEAERLVGRRSRCRGEVLGVCRARPDPVIAGAAATTPMPVSMYVALRMTPRDDGALIQARIVASGVLAGPISPATFSEISTAASGRTYPVWVNRATGLTFSGLICPR